MRLRLPKVGGLLCAGDISYATFHTIVYRTDLFTDPEILAAVDTSLAGRAARWPTMTRGRLAGYVDKLVARADADAVRRRRERHQDREITIWGGTDGVTEIGGRLFTTVPRKREVPPAHAVDARLDGSAGTVCAEDPRARAQRRADALGALAAGANRLACRCGRTACPAGNTPPPSSVLIHVVAEQATLDGTGSTPGSLIGADALIPPELLAELADHALRRSLIHPGDTAPESGYLPSSRGGATHASKVPFLCRFGPGASTKSLVNAPVEAGVLFGTWEVTRVGGLAGDSTDEGPPMDKLRQNTGRGPHVSRPSHMPKRLLPWWQRRGIELKEPGALSFRK